MMEKSAKAVSEKAAAPVTAARSWTQGGLPARADRFARDTTCRSCGKRPGRPTAIIGQLTATELCEVCAALRKERIRANRASARGYRV